MEVGLALIICGCGCEEGFVNVNIIKIIQEKTGRGQRGEGTRHKGEGGGGGGYSILTPRESSFIFANRGGSEGVA